ncbi:MAG: DUF2993 domain-containing protein [Cyanobacteria bacterium RU_5_0]|nr:DUF2993 domain-containing protein [Cyanobacteria bacterium RU_5_0]
MVVEQDLSSHLAKQSRIISKVLPPAVQLWLRSQVESIEALHLHIEGNDRQILSGYIPKVTIDAQKVVYQGISLSQIHLTGETIRINLGQVVRGKPLRLLDVVPVQVKFTLHQADLEKSARSPLLSKALSDLMIKLLQSGLMTDLPEGLQRLAGDAIELGSPDVQIDNDRLTLSSYLIDPGYPPMPIAICTQLRVIDGSKICLEQPQLSCSEAEQPIPLPDLQGFAIDLGSEVTLRELSFTEGKIVCCGYINVIP